jgi:hypothetical protein
MGYPHNWIDHAYMFGLHYLNHQSYLWVGPFQDLYYQADHDCLLCLESVGIPTAIPQWDGWCSPTYNDITCIQSLMSCDNDRTGKSCFIDFEWLPTGAPAIFQELTGQVLWAAPISAMPGNPVTTSNTC